MATGTIDSTGSASSDCAQTIRLDGAMDRVLGEGMVPSTVVSITDGEREAGEEEAKPPRENAPGPLSFPRSLLNLCKSSIDLLLSTGKNI